MLQGDIIIQAENGVKYENIERFEVDSSKTKTILFQSLFEGEEGNIQN